VKAHVDADEDGIRHHHSTKENVKGYVSRDSGRRCQEKLPTMLDVGLALPRNTWAPTACN